MISKFLKKKFFLKFWLCCVFAAAHGVTRLWHVGPQFLKQGLNLRLPPTNLWTMGEIPTLVILLRVNEFLSMDTYLFSIATLLLLLILRFH